VTKSWKSIERELQKVGDGELDVIHLSSHGAATGDERIGLQNKNGNLHLSNLPLSTEREIRQKLSTKGRLVISVCRGGRYRDGMQAWADKIGKPVVANTGDVSKGNFGKGNWILFEPSKSK